MAYNCLSLFDKNHYNRYIIDSDSSDRIIARIIPAANSPSKAIKAIQKHTAGKAKHHNYKYAQTFVRNISKRDEGKYVVSLTTIHGSVNATFDVYVRDAIGEGDSNKLKMVLIAITGEIQLVRMNEEATIICISQRLCVIMVYCPAQVHVHCTRTQ